MKKLIFIIGLFTTGIIHAENAVTLESFESGISAASLAKNPGGRPMLNPPGVLLEQYSSAGRDDANVTQGDKSLKVVLGGKEKFSFDFQIKLSAEASAKVRKAAASADVARFILRYDVVFPLAADFAYFNSAFYFGDSRDVLISPGGKATMSVALDLISGLPADGPLTLVFADDFDLKADFTNVTMYVDNLRLVDTYATGVKPVVHVLQSFEDTNNPTGGATNFTGWDNDKPVIRTSFSQYTATGPGDVRVTEGQHALRVVNSNPGFWHADFILPFENTKLAEVLKLDQPVADRPAPEQLARYTLRWDVTYPDLTDEWMNSTYHTMEALLPIIQVRQNKAKNQRLTYSVTLDQTRWSSWKENYPVLLFINDGPQKTRDTKVYYDNFRLIDTGDASASGKVAAPGN